MEYVHRNAIARTRAARYNSEQAKACRQKQQYHKVEVKRTLTRRRTTATGCLRYQTQQYSIRKRKEILAMLLFTLLLVGQSRETY